MKVWWLPGLTALIVLFYCLYILNLVRMAHYLYVQKRSCLLWSSDIFLKVCACKFYRKTYGCIFTIYVSMNAAVWHEVRTHFESSPLASYTKKSWAHFHDSCVQKHNCLLWSSDTFWKFLFASFTEKDLGAFSLFMGSKRSCVPWSLDAFRKFSACKVSKKVLGTYSRNLHPEMKLLAVEFRRSLEGSALQVL